MSTSYDYKLYNQHRNDAQKMFELLGPKEFKEFIGDPESPYRFDAAFLKAAETPLIGSKEEDALSRFKAMRKCNDHECIARTYKNALAGDFLCQRILAYENLRWGKEADEENIAAKYQDYIQMLGWISGLSKTQVIQLALTEHGGAKAFLEAERQYGYGDRTEYFSYYAPPISPSYI